MTALNDLSDLINRSTGGNSGTPETLFFHKQPRIAGAAAVATIAGRPASLWQYDGSPGAGVAPTSVAVPDNTTNGGLKQTDPGGGRQKWMTQAWATGLVGGTILLYDRLLHIGNLNGTTATAQTVGGTLTRYTDGLGNFVFAEIYTQIGATPASLTMSYTDETGTAGTANSTSPAVQIGNTNFREVSRAVLMPLAAGDKGVKSVSSITATPSTGTAGNYGVVIGHPLAYLAVGAPGAAGWRDFVTGLPGIPEVLTDACLALLWTPATVTPPELMGGLTFVEK